MLRILGSARQLCDGVTRRDLLRVGRLGLAGMGLADLTCWQQATAAVSASRPSSFGKAKSVILIHLWGSPSQIEWVDPKPDAPAEIRGEFGSIPSNLPGCRVCELLPKLAQTLDRATVLRSMTHPYPLHGVAYALTGMPAAEPLAELNPRDPRNWPFFGSVVSYLEAHGEIPAPGHRRVPANIGMPFRLSSHRPQFTRAGPFAMFLGSDFDPLWTEYVGKSTQGNFKPGDERFGDDDPYIGLSSDSYFVVPAATSLQPEITLDRLHHRKSLRSQLDDARRDLSASARGKQFNRYRDMTYELIESDALRDALDVRQESATVRDSYGATLFGQSCLAARRLIERGCRVVTVFWDEIGTTGGGWDTHSLHFERMKRELCPGLDAAWHGLITDLDQRGMLDETLVVCTSEHGRTPKIMPAKGGGRDHWSRAYSSLLAGGGTKRGCVVGATDKQAGDVVDRPISPKDLLATMYHLLGIDHHTLVHDALGRPLPLVEGQVIGEVLA